jgi:hypothetical protein
MSEDIVYNLSDIVDFGTSVPPGDYAGKVADVKVGETKKGDPKIVVTFEISDGEYVGNTFDKHYLMMQGKTKNGGTWCRGVSDLRADARAAGTVANLPKSFTLATARKVFAETLGKKKLNFTIARVADDKDPEKSWPRLVVTGRADIAHAATGEDPLAGLLG